MKLLVIGDAERVRKYTPKSDLPEGVEVVVMQRGSSDEDILKVAADADFIMADAISPVGDGLINNMPNLKLIHSEGVGYNAIDITTAKERGVKVCNNAGVNATAVAEQAILLMLSCLREVVVADTEVRAGRQIVKKESMMVEGIRELGDCNIGFIGFGAIAQECAWRLTHWGCKMFYNKRNFLSAPEEHRLKVSFATADEIVETCDIVSLHVPVTPATEGMVDAAFLGRMRSDAILINTARGELVDNVALANALEKGTIAAAGLDTLYPEPVERDNPLLNLSEDAAKRVVFSPHIGGTTEGMFYRAHAMVWENISRFIAGESLKNEIC